MAGFSQFFFIASGVRRDLHSFPTRRSSDLKPRALLSFDLNDGVQLRGRIERTVGQLEFRDFRSEEHTSELQSRFDLVCRLLLEKKKHTMYMYYCLILIHPTP